MKKIISAVIFITLFFSIIFSAAFAQTKKKPAKILKNSITVKKIDVLNSSYPETNLSITPDGKYLFFMSENPSSWSTKNYNGIGRYDGDIWYSQKTGSNWQKPKNLGRTINTPQGEDEPNVSPDGQTVYFQSWRNDWRTTGGPYYKAELSGSNWRNLQGLGSGITEFFKSRDPNNLGGTLATDGATFSPDGKKFIVAFGKTYTDNMDLYLSKKDSRGNWGEFKKLSVNTSYNERCPFLAADGKTLYFASNGYDGFGKLDIYKTTLDDDGSCGEVLNVGEPFNTKDDDYGFVLTASGNEAYFVRSGDIYYADLKKSTEDLKPSPMVILNGIVRDSLTRKPLEATVKLKDISNNQDVATSRSNSNSGEYSVVLPVGKKYIQIVTKKGYQDFSRTFSIPENANFKEMKYDVNLLAAGTVIQPIDNTPPAKKDSIPAKRDSVVKIIKDTTRVVTENKDTVPKITPIQTNDIQEDCRNRFYLYHNISVGLTGSIPLSYGLKVEYDYQNFGVALGALHFPQIGELDETKPDQEFKNDNFSNLFLLALTYHFPINCKFYPLIGVYGGLQFREWKKDIGTPLHKDIQSGNYTAKHFGAALGLKYFLLPEFYLEGSLGFGTNSVHSQPSGDLLRWDTQILAWLGICCNFQLK